MHHPYVRRIRGRAHEPLGFGAFTLHKRNPRIPAHSTEYETRESTPAADIADCRGPTDLVQHQSHDAVGQVPVDTLRDAVDCRQILGLERHSVEQRNQKPAV